MKIFLCAILLVLTLTVGASESQQSVPQPDKPAAEPDKAASPEKNDGKGVILVQEVKSTGGPREIPPHQVTFKCKGQKFRTDVGNGMGYQISDTETGTTITVLNFNKTFVKQKMSKSEAKESAEALTDPDAPKPEKPKASGRKDTINGLEATEYVGVVLGKHATFWVCSNYPDADLIRKKLDKAMANDPFMKATRGQITVDPADLPKGMIVRTEIDFPDGRKTMTNVISAKLADIEDAEFQPPADYKEHKIPERPAVPQQ